jgi:hypothetical protein
MTKFFRVFRVSIIFFALVFFLSGCNGVIPSLSMASDVQVEVGSDMPNFLEYVELDGVLEEDVVIDYSNVNMDVIGDYVVSYTLPSENDEEPKTYMLAVHVVAYDGYYAPTIKGVTNLTYVIGEAMPDLMEGVSAEDLEYGDLTHRIDVSSNIDYDTPGRYEVKYQVENIDGYSTFELATIEVVYDKSVIELPEQFIVVYQDGFAGVKSITGEDVVAIEYDNIYYVGSGILVLEKNDSTYFYNSETDEFISYEYDLVTPFINGLAVVRNSFEYSGFDYDSVYGREFGPEYIDYYIDSSVYSYMNIDGEVILPFIYSEASVFIDGRAFVRIGNNEGIIDELGNEIITIKYDYIVRFPQGHFLTSEDGKYILMDENGTEVMELSRNWYNDRTSYDGKTIYTVEIGGNAAVLDENLDLILQTNYPNITIWEEYYSSDDTFYVWGSESYGAIYTAKQGLMVDKVIDYSHLEEDVLFRTARGWGLYDLVLNKVAIEPKYQSLEALYGSDNLLIAGNKDGEIAIVTSLGTVQDDFFVGTIDNDNLSGFYEDGYYQYMDDSYNYGLLDLNGRMVTSGTYNFIDRFYDGYARVQDEIGRWNFIDEDGTLMISFSAKRANNFEDGVASVQTIDLDKGWQLINTDFEILTVTSEDENVYYYSIAPFHDGFAAVRKDSYSEAAPYNFINQLGEELSETGFYQTELFYDGYAAVRFTSDPSSWGLINDSGDVIVQGNFDDVYSVVDGIFMVYVDGTYSYYNTDGEKAIDDDFDGARSFSNGRAIVAEDIGEELYYKVIDTSGNVIYNTETTTPIYSYSNGLALTFDEDGFVIYIDTDGEVAIQTDYRSGNHFSGGFVIYNDQNTGLMGYINTSGEEITEAIFSGVGNFQDDSAFTIVRTEYSDYGWGIMDKAGNMVLEPIYDIVYEYEGPRYRVTDEFNNITYYNIDGNTLSTEILNVDEFGNSRQKVYVYQSGWEIRNGSNVLVSGDYDDIVYNRFNPSYTTYLDGKIGLVSTTGIELLEPLYTFINYDQDEMFIYAGVISENYWEGTVNIGVFTLDGDEIVPPQYDDIYYDEANDLFIVENGSLVGYYDTEGNMILEVEYYHAEFIDALADEEALYMDISKQSIFLH